jgi:hypothetical protein
MERIQPKKNGLHRREPTFLQGISENVSAQYLPLNPDLQGFFEHENMK